VLYDPAFGFGEAAVRRSARVDGIRPGAPNALAEVALFGLGNLVKLVPYSVLACALPTLLTQARLFFWCYAILLVAAAKLLNDALRVFSG
jgi:hypothetical protein